MGTLRLALALIVMVFHAGVPVSNLSYGVSAVVAFFLISGFAIAGLVKACLLLTSQRFDRIPYRSRY